ncbi:uncharacterized protein BT62DRAFT_937768 [Guyanagaster necrorhizus]|uniref:Uncharacterized protein n=1 Tax=Guyanagaster necrorhizus TaxID=856835 RepID=A0A9P7VIX2_9AGAR|nr:uncharacterized protein BT62DRAFT_937768 [Guyanagaster necrorhizus MCA 3950]KAG7440789.1 hypothetical protein BT62DRAFT_937768 [Guyanagaster necrorhizus MCA 3950]
MLAQALVSEEHLIASEYREWGGWIIIGAKFCQILIIFTSSPLAKNLLIFMIRRQNPCISDPDGVG